MVSVAEHRRFLHSGMLALLAGQVFEALTVLAVPHVVGAVFGQSRPPHSLSHELVLYPSGRVYGEVCGDILVGRASSSKQRKLAELPDTLLNHARS